MSAFKFNLEPLYEHRQREEEESQRAFAEANLKLQAQEGRLEELKGLFSTAGMELDSLKEKGAPGHELQMHQTYLEGVKRQIAAQEATVLQHAKAAEKKRLELIEAARNKKVMEIMKERSLSAHMVKEGRREQKEADDLTSARMRRKGNES